MAAGLAVLGSPLVAGGASAASFANPTPVVVPRPGPPPGCPPRCPSEQARPFPSTIAVGGLAGTVTDVNVTLRDLTYEFNGPPDADVVLVAPGGKAVMLMSDACGDDAAYNPIARPITLSFDDQAGATLPADAPCSAGTFRPLDDDDDGEFPFHQPDEFPGGPAAPATTLPLSTLNGIDPNGAWSLYVVDDYPNDPDPAGRAGQLGGGWSMEIATPAGAVTATRAPTPAAPAPTIATSVPTIATPGTTVLPPGVDPGQSAAPTTAPGLYRPLADTHSSDNTVLWVVVGFLLAATAALVVMLGPGGWRFWRR